MGGLKHESAFKWSMTNKNGGRVELDQEEYQAMVMQRNNMLVEWGWYREEGEETYEEGEESISRGRTTRMMPGGPPLPAAFEEAFSPIVDADHLLGFMVWEGVNPQAELVAELRRKRDEWEAAWRQKQDRMQELSFAAKKQFDGSVRAGLGSGQLVAHFTYLALGESLIGGDQPKAPKEFGLKRMSEAPRQAPPRGQDLHAVVNSGKIAIESATGCSFGSGALTLKLRNDANNDIEVAIRRGTIFEHTNWVHRQNLMVSIDYIVTVPRGSSVMKKMNAYCMNLSCACSSGNPMNLTDFYVDASEILDSQGKVWDHFENKFGRR